MNRTYTRTLETNIIYSNEQNIYKNTRNKHNLLKQQCGNMVYSEFNVHTLYNMFHSKDLL